MRAYVAVTKPRIIELLLITTIPPMVLANDGWPGWWLVLATLIGGTLSAGGANVLNNYVDSDIDVVMERTKGRPLPKADIPPEHALRFGVILGAAGFLWLWGFTNLLAASISTAALLFYVFVYTMYLKRSSRQNIVIGGAAGAAPVLVGWAAVTGRVDLAAWIMFAIVFYWTPPHFWALAIKRKNEYAKAGLPMLPVTHGIAFTKLHILLYTILLIITTLIPFLIYMTGLIYLAGALALGVGFLYHAIKLYNTGNSDQHAMKTFGYSIFYLSALFGFFLIDHYARIIIRSFII